MRDYYPLIKVKTRQKKTKEAATKNMKINKKTNTVQPHYKAPQFSSNSDIMQ